MDLCLYKWSCGPLLSMSKYDMVRYHQAERICGSKEIRKLGIREFLTDVNNEKQAEGAIVYFDYAQYKLNAHHE